MYDTTFILSKNDFSVNIFFGLIPNLLKDSDPLLAIKGRIVDTKPSSFKYTNHPVTACCCTGTPVRNVGIAAPVVAGNTDVILPFRFCFSILSFL